MEKFITVIHPIQEKKYTREEVKEIGLAALSLGMDIRQNQLKGTGSDKSGKELYYEWFDKHYPG
jgi:hypothetical protein